MKRNTSHTIKRAQRFPVILIGEGLLVGAVGGLIVLLYRIALTCAGKWLGEALAFIKGNPLRIAGWFAVLMLLAVLVGKLIKWEPMISGSGIPQVEGEILGKLNQNWLKVLPAKFAGGFLCLFGGLSLGREGPSIQLGVMSGQGISRCGISRSFGRRYVCVGRTAQRVFDKSAYFGYDSFGYGRLYIVSYYGA